MMSKNWFTRHAVRIWQVAFLLVGSSWLFGPALNRTISGSLSFISHYEVAGMPYGWLFRACDALAGVLLVLAAAWLYRRSKKLTLTQGLLAGVGLAFIIDVIATASCSVVASVCVERLSFSNSVHGVESLVVGLILFWLPLRDAYRRRTIPSVLFCFFQLACAVLFATHALGDHAATLIQFAYQFAVITWLAWFVGDLMAYGQPTVNKARVNGLIAFWVAANGVAAILLSLAHLDYPGVIEGLYFAPDTAWVAQHGVIIGVGLLYVSRHIARGERRAWRLLLAILGVEILTYAAIVPQPLILGIYLLTFAALFALKGNFNRGIVQQNWQSRVVDAAVIFGGVVLAVFLVGYLLLREPRSHRELSLALNHYSDFVTRANHFTQTHIHSALLAHTLTALLAATVWVSLWVLFRPILIHENPAVDQDHERAEKILKRYARSSEDFLKVWPTDKYYFWSDSRQAFIAFKIVGPVAFALADPIARTRAGRQQLLQDFVAYCQAHGWRACFLLVPSASRPMYQLAGLRTVAIGASALVNLQTFVTKDSRQKWWRWQRNRGQKEGYVYESHLPPHSDDLLQELKSVSDVWLGQGGRREQTFALGYFDANYLQRCRVHSLRKSGRVVAFVNELPLYGSVTQTTIDLMRFTPEAPGAMPYLLYQLLLQLAEERRYTYFDMGFVPLARMQGKLASIARSLGANRFSASGLEQFKEKFNPDWQPNFLAYDGDLGDLTLAALHLEKAMRVPE
jgi:lysylphosphatidylglycerol synthetase-like protein (DUF2156 family)